MREAADGLLAKLGPRDRVLLVTMPFGGVKDPVHHRSRARPPRRRDDHRPAAAERNRIRHGVPDAAGPRSDRRVSRSARLRGGPDLGRLLQRWHGRTAARCGCGPGARDVRAHAPMSSPASGAPPRGPRQLLRRPSRRHAVVGPERSRRGRRPHRLQQSLRGHRASGRGHRRTPPAAVSRGPRRARARRTRDLGVLRGGPGAGAERSRRTLPSAERPRGTPVRRRLVPAADCLRTGARRRGARPRTDTERAGDAVVHGTLFGTAPARRGLHLDWDRRQSQGGGARRARRPGGPSSRPSAPA